MSLLKKRVSVVFSVALSFVKILITVCRIDIISYSLHWRQALFEARMSNMTREKFLSILRHAIRFRAKKQTDDCRCADCCNERQKRRGKIVGAASK